MAAAPAAAVTGIVVTAAEVKQSGQVGFNGRIHHTQSHADEQQGAHCIHTGQQPPLPLHRGQRNQQDHADGVEDSAEALYSIGAGSEDVHARADVRNDGLRAWYVSCVDRCMCGARLRTRKGD